MKILRRCVIFLLGMFTCFPALAAIIEVEERAISPKEQAEILEALKPLIEENYVLEDKAPLLSDGLTSALAAGLFDEPMATEEFVQKANRVLQDSFPDRHLGLLTPTRYSRIKEMFGDGTEHQAPEPEAHSGAPESHSAHTPTAHAPAGHAPQAHAPQAHGPEMKMERAEREKQGQETLRQIAGITRVAEINRDGLNQIGYIAFERLIDSDRSRQVIHNIFQTFTESERIIIDLRDCGGGDAGIVTLLSSYFFEEPTHLVSSVVRGEAPVERWTEPNSLSPIFAKKQLDVLISYNSFSAAESFAFGMKQTGRARLLGQATGGGGHMNDFFALPHGFGASISIGSTYDPRTGEGWQSAGVTPDAVFQKDHTLSETTFLVTAESGKLGELSDEEHAIYDSLQGYVQAWYNATADDMRDLISRKYEAQYASASGMEERNYRQQIQATKDGVGVLPQLYHNRIIEEIIVNDDRATANLILRETSHAIELRKTKNGWKIVRDIYRDKGRHG